jgi:hypothetical protein
MSRASLPVINAYGGFAKPSSLAKNNASFAFMVAFVNGPRFRRQAISDEALVLCACFFYRFLIQLDSAMDKAGWFVGGHGFRCNFP